MGCGAREGAATATAAPKMSCGLILAFMFRRPHACTLAELSAAMVAGLVCRGDRSHPFGYPNRLFLLLGLNQIISAEELRKKQVGPTTRI